MFIKDMVIFFLSNIQALHIVNEDGESGLEFKQFLLIDILLIILV